MCEHWPTVNDLFDPRWMTSADPQLDIASRRPPRDVRRQKAGVNGAQTEESRRRLFAASDVVRLTGIPCNGMQTNARGDNVEWGISGALEWLIKAIDTS